MSDSKEYRKELKRLNREYEKAKKSGDSQRRGIYKRKLNELKKNYLSGEIERLQSSVLTSSEKGKLTKYKKELRKVNISISIQKKDKEDRRYGRGIYKERTSEERKASARKGVKTKIANQYRKAYWEGLSSSEKAKITREKNKERKRLAAEKSKKTKFKNKVSKHISKSIAKSIEKINKKQWDKVANLDVDRYLEQRKQDDKEAGYEFERADLLFKLYGFIPKELMDAIMRRYGADYVEPILADIYYRNRVGGDSVDYKKMVSEDLKLKNEKIKSTSLRSTYVSNYREFDPKRTHVFTKKGDYVASYGSYLYSTGFESPLSSFKEYKTATEADFKRHLELYGNPEILKEKLFGKKEFKKSGAWKDIYAKDVTKEIKKRAEKVKNFVLNKNATFDEKLHGTIKKLYDKLKPKSFRIDIKKGKNKFDFDD